MSLDTLLALLSREPASRLVSTGKAPALMTFEILSIACKSHHLHTAQAPSVIRVHAVTHVTPHDVSEARIPVTVFRPLKQQHAAV